MSKNVNSHRMVGTRARKAYLIRQLNILTERDTNMNVIDELKLLADAKTSIYGSICVAQAALDALEQSQIELGHAKAFGEATHNSLEWERRDLRGTILVLEAHRQTHDRQITRIEQLEAAMQEFVDRCVKGEVLSKYTRAKFELLLAGDARTEDALGNPLRYGSSRGFLAKETITMRPNETLDQMITRGLRDGLLEPLPSNPETVEDTNHD